jgi:hypothetical protein
MRSRVAAVVRLALLFTVAACAENESGERIVGSWVIDEAAQREEIGRVSPAELEEFDEIFRLVLLPIRETFHKDGRYEVSNSLGGPFADHWKLVSKAGDTVAIRSSGHSWVSRQPSLSAGIRELSPSVLTYTFSDDDHMSVTTTMLISGEETELSFYFERAD